MAVRGDGDDALRVAAAADGFVEQDSMVRVVRTAARDEDSLWAAAGGTLVRWPAAGAPPTWTAAAHADTVSALYANDIAVIHPFLREWQPGTGAGRTIARWIDGAPAATERNLGAGCVRDVAISVPARGDLVLRSDFARLLEILTAPCGRIPAGMAAASAVDSLAGSGPLATEQMILAPAIRVTPLMPWLLGLALVMALAELLARRRSRPVVEAP